MKVATTLLIIFLNCFKLYAQENTAIYATDSLSQKELEALVAPEIKGALISQGPGNIKQTKRTQRKNLKEERKALAIRNNERILDYKKRYSTAVVIVNNTLVSERKLKKTKPKKIKSVTYISPKDAALIYDEDGTKGIILITR